MQINSNIKSLLSDKELKTKKADDIKIQPHNINNNPVKDEAALIEVGKPVICYYCGTYDHKGIVKEKKLTPIEPKERPIRIKQYMEDNPEAKKILHEYNDWLKEDIKKIPNSTDNFKKFLEEQPELKKHAEPHMDFFQKYLSGWRSFQNNPNTQLNPVGKPNTLIDEIDGVRPVHYGFYKRPLPINEGNLPGEIAPNGETIKFEVPKTKLHKYVQNNPDVKEVLKDYSDWANDNNVTSREFDVFNKYLANNEKAEKYAEEHKGFFNRLFKRFENLTIDSLNDYIY